MNAVNNSLAPMRNPTQVAESAAWLAILTTEHIAKSARRKQVAALRKG